MKVLKMNLPTEFDLSDLGRIDLFRNLTRDDLRRLGELLHRKTFPAGKSLMTVDQTGEVVYFILSGAVKVHIEQEDGSDVSISILGPGEIIGEMSALDQTNRSASVITIEKTTLLWLDRETFRRYVMAIPAVAADLACTISSRLRSANEQIQSLATVEVETRIARRIIAFAERYGQQLPNGDLLIPIRLTQTDIATLVGASREHTNKILVSYKERGYLSVDHNYHITIHDKTALARRCN
jgi:CRP/FNR family transcriptional regulator, cyclic AMP receptor protein